MTLITFCKECGAYTKTRSEKLEDGSIRITYYCPNGCLNTSKQSEVEQ